MKMNYFSRAIIVASVLLACLSTAGAQTEELRMLIRVDVSSAAVKEAIDNFPAGLDVAGIVPGRYMDIVVLPSQLWRFAQAGIPYQVMMKSPQDLPPYSGKATYHTYDAIRTELLQIVADHPGITKLDTIATAAQGGKVWCLKVSDNPAVNDNTRHGILIMGNHHAREWMTPEIVLYLANYMTNNYNPTGTDSISTLVKTKEFFFIPTVNPDGFIYDNGGTYGAGLMWRKNRRQNSPTVFGVDLNRGYDGSEDGDIRGAWGSTTNSYTSPDSSNDVFYGVAPSGEPEQQAVMKLVNDHNIVLSLSYHSYSELVIWPLGYVDSLVKRAPDSTQLEYFGRQMAARIKRLHSTLGYTPEQGSALYSTTGDSEGWIYGYGLAQLGRVILAYCIEVDTAFYTPPSHIDSVCPQTLKGTLYMVMRTDSMVSLTSPPPVLPPVLDPPSYPLKTKGTDFMLAWQLLNPLSNPSAYELQELSGLQPTTDTVGAATNPNVALNGFASSTTRMYSGSRSYYSSVGNQYNIASITTVNPYYVSSVADSFSFYSYQAMTTFDRMWVEISSDGKQWDLLGKLYQNALTWTKRAFAIDSSKYFGKSVYFRVRLVGDGAFTTDGVYIDDIKPVAAFDSVKTLSSTITSQSYTVTGRPEGSTYYYRVRGYNAKRNWGDWSQLRKVYVILTAVELSYFKAQYAEGKSVLGWRTESERECYRWLVERSEEPDGGYGIIGELKGHGSTSQPHDYDFTDETAVVGKTYYYRLVEEDTYGKRSLFGPVSVTVVSREKPVDMLGPALPNPFSDLFRINYQVASLGHVNIVIYNITGQIVKVLVDGIKPAGVFEATWDGTDRNNKKVNMGVYFYRLTVNGYMKTGRVVKIK
jgi:carboxypeptidase T